MTWKLYYDGGCNLCHASKLRVVKWARKAQQPLDAEFLQSAEALEKGYGMDAMVLEADGKVYVGADAWLRLMSLAPWYLRWIGAMRHLPVTRWLAKGIYAVVAKYRLKWFGTRACQLPAAGARKS